MKKERPSWDEYFMAMAKLVATRSTCLRRQVGAVAVMDHQILATGYNGAATGRRHCLDVGCIRDELGIESGKEAQICRAIHAEQNVICQAAKNGASVKGATIYCTHQPCSICARIMLNAGIARVYFEHGYPDVETLELLNGKIYRITGGKFEQR